MQLEPIVKVRFKRFVEQYGLQGNEESKNFEIYVNYLIFTSHQTDVFSVKTDLFETINVGGTDDLGLDGIGIKINDAFIASKDDVLEYVKAKKKINIELFFTQSKYRPNFVASEFNVFQSGVVDAVSEKRYKVGNSKVNAWLELIDFILSEEVMILWDKKPSIRVYFVAMGKWYNDANIIAYENKMRDDIAKIGNYDEVKVHYIDTNRLSKIIDNNENNFEAIISIGEQISFPEVEGVTNGALIYTDSDELMKLLNTDEQIIRKSLFYDNVRAFQGDTTINAEIFKTIEDSPEKFILFNNGITIVCEKFTPASRKATIKNPQIVNGCQTCNVIYNYYENHNFESVKIPLAIKIIATENSNLVNQVVRTTNRQNIVLDEVFEITREFHKNLEEYFLSIKPVNDKHKLFYERRSKQFLGDYSIKVSQKINLRILTQSSVAILLEKPYISHRHESVLLRQFRNDIFQDMHSYEPYYVISEIHTAFERYFANNNDKRKTYKVYQSHLMMIFKLITASTMPNLSDNKKIDKYCDILRKCLANESACKKAIEDSILIFEEARNVWVNVLKKSKFAIKDTEEFATEIIKQIYSNSNAKHNKIEVSRTGMVISVKKDKNDKYFAFIKADPENIPIFEATNPNLQFTHLLGNFVSYDISGNLDGRQKAINVRLCKA